MEYFTQLSILRAKMSTKTTETKFDKFKKRIRPRVLNLLVALMVVALVLFALWNQIFIPVYSGQLGVLFHRFGEGTVVDRSYGEGTQVIWPWDLMYIYNVRQQIVTKEVDVLSKDGLKIKVEFAVRFSPNRDSLGILHKRLGPEYPETVVVPEAESSTRNIIARYTPDELYAINRKEVETLILKDVRSDFGDSLYVKISDVMIKNIALPAMVAEAIEAKLTEEQKDLTYAYRLKVEEKEAQRKEIEAGGIRRFEEVAGIPILKWRGVEATEKLAASPNSKVIVVGTKDLPIILGGDNGIEK
ncbi:MAG: prohibitin family protein [Bacteroidia bacterium]|nr:prohibitin family protein [Bacteroidia bacterium]